MKFNDFPKGYVYAEDHLEAGVLLCIDDIDTLEIAGEIGIGAGTAL